MARTIKTPPAPAEDVGNDRPTYAFERFKWTPNDLPHGATVPARELCQLVDHVMDVAVGAATVFELMADHDQDIESFNSAYMNPYHLGRLRRLAVRSLESLDDKAGEIATRLHKMARGEA